MKHARVCLEVSGKSLELEQTCYRRCISTSLCHQDPHAVECLKIEINRDQVFVYYEVALGLVYKILVGRAGLAFLSDWDQDHQARYI